MGHDVGQLLFYAISRRRVETACNTCENEYFCKMACLLYFTFVNEILFKNVIVFSETMPFTFNFFY